MEIEEANRRFSLALRKWRQTKPQEWERVVNAFVAAYRSSVGKSTNPRDWKLVPNGDEDPDLTPEEEQEFAEHEKQRLEAQRDSVRLMCRERPGQCHDASQPEAAVPSSCSGAPQQESAAPEQCT